MKRKIFQNFPPASKEDWVNQAKKDLKVADVETQLMSVASEGFPILPFYTAEDTTKTKWVKAFYNQVNPPQDTQGLPVRHWVNAVEVNGATEAALNLEIQLVLNNGADGLILPLSGVLDWNKVLSGVVLPSVSIWVQPLGNDPLPILEAFSSWLDQQALASSDL